MMSFEDAIVRLNELNECSRSLVTLATLVGLIIIVKNAFKFVYIVYKDLRLYVINQTFCKTNFREKYGKWAVISGATDGIGLALAKQLAKRGMSIVVIGRNEEKLSKTKQLLCEQANAGEIITIKIDLSDSSVENYESIREQLDADNRDIGIFVNSAGLIMYDFKRFHQYQMEDIRSLTNVSGLSGALLTRMILPGMIKRERGLIINVLSPFSKIHAPYMSVYSPAKAFATYFSENLQIEYADYPIDIVNLNPGAIRTKLLENAAHDIINIFSTSTDKFAESCLNALSTPYESLCGNLFSELSNRTIQIIYHLGISAFAWRIGIKMMVKNVELSPFVRKTHLKRN